MTVFQAESLAILDEIRHLLTKSRSNLFVNPIDGTERINKLAREGASSNLIYPEREVL